MSCPNIAIPPIETECYDPARQLKAQDEAARKFAQAMASFLLQAFPHVEAGCANALRDSFIGLICCGTDEQLRNIERQKEMMARYPFPKTFNPPSDEELLIDLVNQRDKLSEQVAQIEAGIASMPEQLQGMMKATSFDLYQGQLDVVNKRISELQDSIEQRAHAVNSQHTTNEEESAIT